MGVHATNTRWQAPFSTLESSREQEAAPVLPDSPSRRGEQATRGKQNTRGQLRGGRRAGGVRPRPGPRALARRKRRQGGSGPPPAAATRRGRRARVRLVHGPRQEPAGRGPALSSAGISPGACQGLPAKFASPAGKERILASGPSGQSQNDSCRLTGPTSQPRVLVGGTRRACAGKRALTVARDAPDSLYGASEEPKKTAPRPAGSDRHRFLGSPNPEG